MDDRPPTTSRRTLLAVAGATAASGLAGCTERLWTAAEPSPYEQVTLTIKTLPAERDAMAVAIASQLAENLRLAGLDAVHEPMEEAALFRQVLINADYDVFVTRHPGHDDPDALRGLLHSAFINEQGWQNPFRFSNDGVDELLEAQRRETGGRRRSTFGDLFERLDGIAPFTTVAFPHYVSVARASLDVDAPPRRAIDYLQLVNGFASTDGAETLRVGLAERPVAERLNPISVEFADRSPIVELVYDPLVRRGPSGPIPWLAESVVWDRGGPAGLAATVTLREGTTWHDGEPLTAADIEFTQRFLEDTTLGDGDRSTPAPRYRGRTSLVDDVTAIDDRRVRFSFGECAEAVAKRALTVPVLPEHVWAERTEPLESFLTEAFEWDDGGPIGSGVYAVETATNDSVTLEPYREHVLLGAEDVADLFDGNLTAIEFREPPNPGIAVENVANGSLDVIASPLSWDDVADVDAEAVRTLDDRDRSFYMVGYNLRHPELSLPQFRRIVSRCIDREYLLEEFLNGRGDVPTSIGATLGFSTTEWDLPSRDSSFGLTFPGTDGRVDIETARALFEDAGYGYEDGELVA